MKGELEIGGKRVNLKHISMPLLNIYASADHLVPPAATRPLNDLVGSEDKTLYEFQGGHIGVFVGGRSQKELAPAIAGWLKARDGKAVAKPKAKTAAKAAEKSVARDAGKKSARKKPATKK